MTNRPSMTAKAQRLLRRISAKHLNKRLVSSATKPPIVSFSFDDIPASAAHVGAPILAKHGVKGTFYLAMSLLSGVEGNEDLFEIDDVSQLIEDGHEIGCHTWGHLRAGTTSIDAYLADISKNAESFSDFFPDYNLVNFSFPFGELTASHKARLAPIFRSLRGIRPGLNAPRADLNLLLANNLYNSRMDMAGVSHLIEEAQRLGGWLIFYTHDVTDTPSRYGCTPDLLSEAVGLAVERGCRVLTMNQALDELGAPP